MQNFFDTQCLPFFISYHDDLVSVSQCQVGVVLTTHVCNWHLYANQWPWIRADNCTNAGSVCYIIFALCVSLFLRLSPSLWCLEIKCIDRPTHWSRVALPNSIGFWVCKYVYCVSVWRSLHGSRSYDVSLEAII